MAHKNREKRAAKKAQHSQDPGQYYEEENYSRGDTQVRRRLMPRGLIVLIVIVVVIVVGLFAVNMMYSNAIAPVDPADTATIEVEIPEGAGTADIAVILQEKDLIGGEFFFRVHSRLQEYDGQFRQGTYTLSRSMSADEIAEILMQGTQADTKNFTIPEGYNITQIARVLEENGIVSEMDFYDEIQNGVFDYAFLEGTPAGPERLEGFLYPETYNVYADATAHDVINMMLAQFDSLFLPEYYDKAQEMGMSVRDVVTMASIVERESVVASERPLMAGVFYNRLEQGMRLESCATIQYILGEPKEFLTTADTQIESPYNTYLYEGLPPGPICNPRMASVEAALYPDDNDYVFFVLSDALDGSHKFSADYNEFLNNKDAYYKAVNG